MKAYIVTVKLPRNPDHDPYSKVTGPCPANGLKCTDVTGEHHSFLVFADDETDIRFIVHGQGFKHITRIEQQGH